MFEKWKFSLKLSAVGLLVTLLAAAVIWGMQSDPVSAAPAALDAHKSVSAQEVAPGQTVAYTIVVTNLASSDVTSLVIGDHLDSNLGTIIPDTTGWDAYSATPGYITFTLNTLGAYETVTASFTAVVSAVATPGTVVNNSAAVSSDSDSPANTNVASFTVSPAPGVQIFSPQNGAVITEQSGGTLPITGKVWATFDPAPIPDVPTLYPISYASGSPSYKVDWSDVADVDYYLLYESTDSVFDLVNDPSYPVDAPSEKIMANKPAGTYYYRVMAYNTTGQYSRLSNVQAVTVTSTGALSFFTPSDTEALGGLTTAAEPVGVEVRVNDGAWAPATLVDAGDWWDWSYDWADLPQDDKVEYTLQARAFYTGVSEYSYDTITVTLDNDAFLVYLPIIFKRWPPIPLPPVLNDITLSGSQATVSWYYTTAPGVPSVSQYQLQRSSDASFAQISQEWVAAETLAQRSVTIDLPGGTHYFRVRGYNSYGWGEWSNVKSVMLGRAYEFTSSTEGWHIVRTDEADRGQVPEPVAQNGSLYQMIIGKADESIISSMEAGPRAPYTIRARVDIVNNETVAGRLYNPLNGMTYGIVFGGNNGTPCPAIRTSSGCLTHYYRVLVTWNQNEGKLGWQLKRIDYHDADGKGIGTTLVGWTLVDHSRVAYNALDWIEWRIEVTTAATDNIRVFMNGVEIGKVTDRTYLNDQYFGTFLAPTAELGGVATKWDYFRVQ